MECAIGAQLRTHQIWDEGPPIEVEVYRAITEFTKERDEAEQATIAKARSSDPEGDAAELQPRPCIVPVPGKVVISAGVAAGMLKTKIDPVHPVEALDNHVSGAVVLHATIRTDGAVKELRVISGPVLIQQAALDAVRQSTYRPYLLNNMPVEFETTINVVFAPNR